MIIYVNSFGRPDIGLRGLFSSPIDTIPSSIDLIGLKNKLAPPIVDLKIAKSLDTHYAWIQHIVLAVAVVVTGVSYLRQGIGGVVPVLMVAVAPVLGVIYTWYFGFKKW